MKRSFRKVIDGIRQNSDLLTLAEKGKSPAEFKQEIIRQFTPFFDDPSLLNTLAIEVLVPEAVTFSKLQKDNWAKAQFDNVLKEYCASYAADATACLETSARFENHIQKGLSEYWSGFHLEVDKLGLPLEEFKYEVCRNIGMLIEATLQPMLRELLVQVRIRRRKASTLGGIDNLDLGLVVGELFDTSGYPELFAPSPWKIRVNQWRNIAQHHKTRVEKDQIIATYRQGSTEKEIKLDRDEFMAVLRRIYTVVSAIQTARTIFILNHLSEWQSKVKGVAVRAEAKVVHLASAFATQGFELLDILVEDKKVTAFVQDVTTNAVQVRMFHASQFVYPVWTQFPKEEVTVHFLHGSGDLIMTTHAKGSDCNDIGRKIVPFEELANRVTFHVSESGKLKLNAHS